MQDIEVPKEKLLAILRENRDKHQEVFTAALAGYQQAALTRLNEKIAALKAGRLPDLYITMDVPQSHVRDYDRIIGMAGMHEGGTFVLTESDYQRYVMDDWQWKRQFLDTSSTYARMSVAKNYGADAGGIGISL
jgi:hypothetical protein